jgi:arylsulfatase
MMMRMTNSDVRNKKKSAFAGNTIWKLRLALLFALSISATLIHPVSVFADPPVVNKTNFLVILTDDMGFSDIGCYGSEIKTPNIDRLTQNGVRFTHFYNTARCSPSRASLLAGLYPHRAEMGHLSSNNYPEPGYHNDLSKIAATMALGDTAKNSKTE